MADNELKVDGNRDGQRLDNYLFARLKGRPKSLIYRWLRKGEIRLNKGRAKPSDRIAEGDLIRLPPMAVNDFNERGVPQPPDWALAAVREAVIHRDDRVLIIDKPAGMAVHAGSGLAFGLIDVVQNLWPAANWQLGHRLDRETSGCIVLLSQHDDLVHFQRQLKGDGVTKQYLCLLSGALPEQRLEINAPIARADGSGPRTMMVDDDGKPARTTFIEQAKYGGCSFAKALIATGRTHQIRVHAQSLELALAGDDRYGDREINAQFEKRGLNRTFLHASAIEFRLADGVEHVHSAPLPDDLNQVLNRL